jgi:hypothetical protein
MEESQRGHEGEVTHRTWVRPGRRREPIAAWAGRLFLLEGRALYVGIASDTGPHAHHAVQIGIALQGEFELRVGRGPRVSYQAAMVAPDAPDANHA